MGGMNMINYRTLEGELVRYDNDFTLRMLDVAEEPYEFYKYFTDVEQITGWEIFVGVLICVGDKPVWGCASCNKKIDKNIVCKEGEELTDNQKRILVNEYYVLSMKELEGLETFAKIVVIPRFMRMIAEIPDDSSPHIIDVREMYAYECDCFGYRISCIERA